MVMVGSALTSSFIVLMVTKTVHSNGDGKIHIHVYHDPRYLVDGLKHLLKANLDAANKINGLNPIKKVNPLDRDRLTDLRNNYLLPLTDRTPPPPRGNLMPFNGPTDQDRRDRVISRINSIINGSSNSIGQARPRPANPFLTANFLSQIGNGIRKPLNVMNRNNGLSELQNVLNNLLEENDRLRKSLNGMDSDDRDMRESEPFDDFLGRNELRQNGDDPRGIFNGISSRIPLNRDRLDDENSDDDIDDNGGIRPRLRPFDDISPRIISPEMNGISDSENNLVPPTSDRGDRNGANRQLNRLPSHLRGFDRPSLTLDDISEEDLRRYRIERYIQLNGPMIQGNSLSGRPMGRQDRFHYRYHGIPYRSSIGNYLDEYNFPFTTPEGPYDDAYPIRHGIRRLNGLGYPPYNNINPRLHPIAPRHHGLNGPYGLYSPFSDSLGRRNGVYHGPYNYRNSFYRNNYHLKPSLNGAKGKTGRMKMHKKSKY